MKKYQAKDLDGKTIRQFGNMEDAIFFAETKGLEVWSGGKCIFHN